MAKMADPVKKVEKMYTYGEYRTWPGDERWELIEGVPYDMSPAPRRYHQEISATLFTYIRQFLKGKSCKAYAAPFDVLLPALGEETEDEVTTVVQPDISVICDKSKLTEEGCTGAPDWIVEILSPYTAKKDFGKKLPLYEKHGVKEFWIIDPGNKYIHIYLLDGKSKYPEDPVVLEPRDSSAESSVLPGLVIDLEELFDFT